MAPLFVSSSNMVALVKIIGILKSTSMFFLRRVGGASLYADRAARINHVSPNRAPTAKQLATGSRQSLPRR